MEIAVVGVPGVGKSLALQSMGASADEASGKKSTARLVVDVPDARIKHLSTIYQPKKTTYARIQFREAVGLGVEHTKGTADFRNNVQGSEALLVVVRDFEFFGEAADPAAEATSVLEELLTLDFMVASNRLERIAEAKKKGKKPEEPGEEEAMQEVMAVLEAGDPLLGRISEETALMLKNYAFLTLKHVVVLLNSDEDRASEPVPAEAPFDRYPAFRASLPIEAEIAELETEEERAEFLADLGIKEPVLHKIIQQFYAAMDLIPFFTVGEDEVRAWTIRRGTKARAAAGVIHSDLSRGFIAAEVLAYDDFVTYNGFKDARTKGRVRIESREYEVKDGDILNVRFNV
jgi:ribosome-binding ATPase